MAWRLQDHILRGDIDNRTRGRITGRVWLAGIDGGEIGLTLELSGDCRPDLAGCSLHFENPNPIPMTTKPLASRQCGIAGEMTAARKVRVFDVPIEEAYALLRAGGRPSEQMANSLYLEWKSQASGRVVIESSSFRLEVSESAWRFTEAEIAEQTRGAETGQPFAVEVRNDGTETEWDEFRCEEFLRESDARGEKFRQLLEKYLDHPDRERIVAYEMGWPWLEEKLAEETEPDSAEQPSNEPVEIDDSLPDELELPPPDPLREGVDWVRDEHGDVVHPIKKRATDMLHELLDELRVAGNPEEQDAALGDFVGYAMILSGKLAGALGSIARGWETDAGLTIAFLKRALEQLHHALAAAERVGPNTAFPSRRLAYFQGELLNIRQQLIDLMATLRLGRS
jgi:hypothetical protein